MKTGRRHKKVRSGTVDAKTRAGSPPGNLEAELHRFMAYHSAKQFSRNLRKMLLEFLMHDNAIEAVYLKELLYDMDGLFDMLDVMERMSDQEETAA